MKNQIGILLIFCLCSFVAKADHETSGRQNQSFALVDPATHAKHTAICAGGIAGLAMLGGFPFAAAGLIVYGTPTVPASVSLIAGAGALGVSTIGAAGMEYVGPFVDWLFQDQRSLSEIRQEARNRASGLNFAQFIIDVGKGYFDRCVSSGYNGARALATLFQTGRDYFVTSPAQMTRACSGGAAGMDAYSTCLNQCGLSGPSSGMTRIARHYLSPQGDTRGRPQIRSSIRRLFENKYLAEMAAEDVYHVVSRMCHYAACGGSNWNASRYSSIEACKATLTDNWHVISQHQRNLGSPNHPQAFPSSYHSWGQEWSGRITEFLNAISL